MAYICTLDVVNRLVLMKNDTGFNEKSLEFSKVTFVVSILKLYQCVFHGICIMVS